MLKFFFFVRVLVSAVVEGNETVFLRKRCLGGKGGGMSSSIRSERAEICLFLSINQMSASKAHALSLAGEDEKKL